MRPSEYSSPDTTENTTKRNENKNEKRNKKDIRKEKTNDKVVKPTANVCEAKAQGRIDHPTQAGTCAPVHGSVRTLTNILLPIDSTAESACSPAHSADMSPPALIAIDSDFDLELPMLSERKRVPSDYVNRLPCKEEMRFNCSVIQGSKAWMAIPCIVDTGCRYGYLLTPSMQEVPFKLKPVSSTICAVNGTRSEITHVASVSIMIAGHSHKNIELRVLLTRNESSIAILFGRELQRQFDVTTHSGTRVTLRDIVLYDADTEIVRLCSEAEEFEHHDGMVDATPEVNLPNMEDSLRLPLDPEKATRVDEQLQKLAAVSSQLLPRCFGRMSLRHLQPTDEKDTSGQSYAFVLELDSKPDRKEKARLYSQSMFAKLKRDHQVEFKNQVAEYTAKGWWTKASREECIAASAGCPANVFGIAQKSKLRLVCDLRDFNKDYPSTTTDQPLIPYSIALLRMQSGGTIIVGDCKSAFYRVRLTKPLWLHCGPEGDFLCHRMAFGLSMGPEGLQQSLGVLWKVFGRNHCGIGSLYVDDFWMHVPANDSTSYAEWLYMLEKCGFDVPKKKSQIAQTVNSEDQVTILSCKLSSRTIEGRQCSIVDCQRERVRKTRDIAICPSASKREVFALAGALAYDPAKCHMHAKICADLMRSVAGASRTAWDADLILPDSDKELLRHLLEWSKELIDNDCTCSHAVATAPSYSTLRLKMYTDASHVGGAYLIKFDNGDNVWSNIYADAWFWKTAEMNYHGNRLEAITLFRGLRALSKFCEFYKRSLFGQKPPNISLEVLSDSSNAVTWAIKGTNSAGYESRAIARLCDALQEEVLILRSIGSFELGHIAGKKNVESDALSRILERPVGSVMLGDVIRKRQLKGKKSKPSPDADDSKEDDVYLLPEEEPRRLLAEECSATSYSIHDAIDRFSFLRRIIRNWKRAACDTNPRYENFTDGYSAEDKDAFNKNLQSSLPKDNPYSVNPFIKTTAGVIEHVRIDYDGSEKRTVLIPKSCPVTQRLIVRTCHRDCHHRGTQYTAAAIKDYWLESRSKVVREVVTNCFKCAIKNAHVQWSLPTTTYARELDLPPFSRISIDHLYLEKTIVMSVICTDTGVMALMATPNDSTSIEDSLVCVKKLTNRFCLQLKRIHCDQASSFTSEKFQKGLIAMGQDPDIEYTTPDAPYTNPVERTHREVLSIIRSKKFLRLCVLDKSRCQDALDEISSVINQRPLGRYASPDGREAVLTPALLAWGGTALAYNLKELRAYFYELCFANLRRVHQKSSNGQRRGSVLVGQRALLLNPTTKLKFPFELCRVVDIQGPYFIVMTSDGKEKRVGSMQLAPLSLPFLDEVENGQNVSRVGARITAPYKIGKEEKMFNGTVVAEHGDLVEIAWDRIDNASWRNELIAWGACSVLASN